MVAPDKVNAGTEPATATTDSLARTVPNVLAQKTAQTTVLAAKATVPVTQGGEV